MGKTIFRSAKLNKNKRAGVVYFALMFAVLCWLSFKAYVIGEWDTKAMLIYAAVMFVFPILSGIPQMVVWWGSGTESQAAGSLFGALFPLALFDIALFLGLTSVLPEMGDMLGFAVKPLSAEWMRLAAGVFVGGYILYNCGMDHGQLGWIVGIPLAILALVLAFAAAPEFWGLVAVGAFGMFIIRALYHWSNIRTMTKRWKAHENDPEYGAGSNVTRWVVEPDGEHVIGFRDGKVIDGGSRWQ